MAASAGGTTSGAAGIMSRVPDTVDSVTRSPLAMVTSGARPASKKPQCTGSGAGARCGMGMGERTWWDRRGTCGSPLDRASLFSLLAAAAAQPRTATEDRMKFGLFDHVEHAGRPLATLFDERLTFVQAADEAGLYCLHVAEHHATPLNMVPVPGIYLSAVARTTRRIRLGPLVYLLPLYSPLRLIEEIAMLDHLSHGRLEVGVGRGVSPFELKYHKVEHDQSRDIFIDAFDCISAG